MQKQFPRAVAATTAACCAIAQRVRRPDPIGAWLAGSGSFQPAPDMKVVVSVALPSQAPIQARFTPLETPKPPAKAVAK